MSRPTSPILTALALALSAGALAQTATSVAQTTSSTRYTLLTRDAPQKAVATAGTGNTLVKRDTRQANQRWARKVVSGAIVLRSDSGFCMVDDGPSTTGGSLKLESCGTGETASRYRWIEKKVSSQGGPSRLVNVKTGRILVRGSDRAQLDRAGASATAEQVFHVLAPPPKVRRPGS